MSTPPALSPRQIAGKINQQKQGNITPAGRQKLREAALAKRPWARSTGPRTPEGKARAAANAKKLRTTEQCERSVVLTEVITNIKRMRELREELLAAN